MIALIGFIVHTVDPAHERIALIAAIYVASATVFANKSSARRLEENRQLRIGSVVLIRLPSPEGLAVGRSRGMSEAA